MMKLWALALASAGSVSALLPVIVPMSDNTNDTQTKQTNNNYTNTEHSKQTTHQPHT